MKNTMTEHQILSRALSYTKFMIVANRKNNEEHRHFHGCDNLLTMKQLDRYIEEEKELTQRLMGVEIKENKITEHEILLRTLSFTNWMIGANNKHNKERKQKYGYDCLTATKGYLDKLYKDTTELSQRIKEIESEEK